MEVDTQITRDDIEMRHTAVKDLDMYISHYRNWLDTSMTKLGFSENPHQQDKDLVECPVDHNHRMPRRALQNHLKYCEAHKKGYSREEADLIESDTSFPYEKHPSVVSVKLDDESFREIIRGKHKTYNYRDLAKEMPLTGERAQYELKREEKLAIYEHVREVARQTNPSNIISEQELLLLQDTKGQKNPAKGKSYLERLAEERDFKRRRQSYRAKNVHVTKKSHTEIIREVIGNQMEILGQMWEEEGEEDKSRHESHNLDSRQERRSRHRSRSPTHRSDGTERKQKSRPRSPSPTDRSTRKDHGQYHDTRSPSRDGKTRNKKSKHSKKRSRSRSNDSKDSRDGKSKHKHKKHKHKKDKREKEKGRKEDDS